MIFQKMNSSKPKFKRTTERDRFFYRVRKVLGMKVCKELIPISDVCTDDNLVKVRIMRSKVGLQTSQKAVAPEGKILKAPSKGIEYVLPRLAI